MFCICLILHILSSKYFTESFRAFSHSSSHLILAQIFAPFDWLRSDFIGLSSCVKFSCNVLSHYLVQETLIFSCKGKILEKYGVCIFSAWFCIFQQVTCGGEVIFHIFKLKKKLFAYEEKICSSEKELLKHHENANFCVCRELYQ